MPSVSTALLLRTDLFRDLESMKPLTIEEGGRQDPFDNRKLQSMMEALKEGDSTAWVSWSWSSTASVPVYKSSVKWIMHTTYKTPQPINLVVAVDDLFMDQKNGQMKRISPPSSWPQRGTCSKTSSRRPAPSLSWPLTNTLLAKH